MTAAQRTVWIVDDSPLEADRARRVLERYYDVRCFGDGESVVEALRQRRRPDVLVLDWVLPGLTGADVCRFARSFSGHDPMSILIVTASGRDQVAEGLAAGANDYLAKPYTDEELLARSAALVRASELAERVEQAEETVRKLLTHTPDGIIVVDVEGRLIYANAEAERLLGKPFSSVSGRPVTELLPGLDVGRADGRGIQTLPDVSVGGEIFSPLARRLPADLAHATTIALRNVTERRQIENRRLDFYSIIAHELRSPLSAVLLRTDLILRGRRGILPAELITDIRKIETNVRSMVALINDFLDLARLEGSSYNLDREDVDLGALVAATADDVRPLVEESRLTLEVSVGDRPLEVAGDRRRIVQVLTNLLSNAIKFTPPGGVVRVGARALSDDQIEVRISDTGQGIAPEDIPHLFERYSRARSATAVAGTGLGLMIVREIVEAHGGTVGVDSAPGRGTTFWVRLPPATRSRRPGPVLVVDDDVEIRDSLRFLLESEGYEVELATNGREALERLAQSPPPGVMFLDLSMPVVTGVEVIEALRREKRLEALPICVMSADLSVLRDRPPGALILQKPISITKVLEYVAQHARPRQVTARVSSMP